MLFCGADKASINFSMEAFKKFQIWSLFIVNVAKSNIFFVTGLSIEIKNLLKRISGFDEESLPIHYFSVSLIMKKLRHKDCKTLVDKILGRTDSSSLREDECSSSQF